MHFLPSVPLQLTWFVFFSAPEIRVKPNDKENIYANETTEIKLPCNIKTTGEEFSYHWQKDNKTFRPSDHRRMYVKFYRWLKIKKVRKDDAGLYTCVVMNKCGEKSSVSMHLYVRERKYLIIVRSLNRQSYASCLEEKSQVASYSDTQVKRNTKKWTWDKFHRGSMKNVIKLRGSWRRVFISSEKG